ncbi:hypothetical protein D3C75_434790 [compost metagenome]
MPLAQALDQLIAAVTHRHWHVIDGRCSAQRLGAGSIAADVMSHHFDDAGVGQHALGDLMPAAHPQGDAWGELDHQGRAMPFEVVALAAQGIEGGCLQAQHQWITVGPAALRRIVVVVLHRQQLAVTAIDTDHHALGPRIRQIGHLGWRGRAVLDVAGIASRFLAEQVRQAFVAGAGEAAVRVEPDAGEGTFGQMLVILVVHAQANDSLQVHSWRHQDPLGGGAVKLATALAGDRQEIQALGRQGLTIEFAAQQKVWRKDRLIAPERQEVIAVLAACLRCAKGQPRMLLVDLACFVQRQAEAIHEHRTQANPVAPADPLLG